MGLKTQLHTADGDTNNRTHRIMAQSLHFVRYPASARTTENAQYLSYVELLRHVGEGNSATRLLGDMRSVWVACVRFFRHRTRYRHLPNEGIQTSCRGVYIVTQ